MRQQLPARVESAEAERRKFAYYDPLYSAAMAVLWLVKDCRELRKAPGSDRIRIREQGVVLFY